MDETGKLFPPDWGNSYPEKELPDVVTTMAKEQKPRKKNLNCSMEAGELITKIANLRGETIEEFFDAPDVREFLNHLLSAEVLKIVPTLKNRK